eukprot:g3712.t1
MFCRKSSSLQHVLRRVDGTRRRRTVVVVERRTRRCLSDHRGGGGGGGGSWTPRQRKVNDDDLMRKRVVENIRIDASLVDFVRSEKTCLDPLDDVFGFENFSQSGMRIPQKSSILKQLENEEARASRIESIEQDLVRSDVDNWFEEVEAEDYEFEVPDPETYFVQGSESYESKENLLAYAKLGGDDGTSVTEDVPPSLLEEFKSTDTKRLMIREPVVEFVSRLNAFESGDYQNGPDAVTLITGDQGTGKSATLAQIVDYCRSKSDWIVLYAPDARKWSKLQPSVEPSERRTDSLTFDQPEFSEELLRNFLDAHREQLVSMPVQDASTSKSASTLAELIERGISKEESADDDVGDSDGAVVALMHELSRVTDYKVLIAVDGFNYLYEDVPYSYNFSEVLLDDEEPKALRAAVADYVKNHEIDDEMLDRDDFVFGHSNLKPELMTLINAFRYLKDPSGQQHRKLPANGFVVGALSLAHNDCEYTSNRFRKEYDTRPIELRIPPKYSRKELQRVLDFYAAQDYLSAEPTSDLTAYFGLRWGGVPEAVRKAAIHPNPTEIYASLDTRRQWDRSATPNSPLSFPGEEESAVGGAVGSS